MSGKVALVTGGAQGIGFSISKELIKNGYKVAICDINLEAGENAVKKLKTEYKGCDCRFYKLDVTKGDQFEDCFLKVTNSQGTVNMLVNNAGVAEENKDNWEYEVDINCKGTVWGCLLGFQYMKRGGTIVNISSLTAIKPYILKPVYSMTKSAVLHITRSFSSKAYSDTYGIKVIAILPGLTNTPILKTSGKYLFPELKKFRDEETSKFGSTQSPEVVADCVLKAAKSGLNGSLWLCTNSESPKLVQINYSFSEPDTE